MPDRDGSPGPPTLHQFLGSHYNEKARWALDWKAVPHRRVSHLPGPHMPVIRRMTGQTATPVLVLGDEVITGSARILARLDERFPERRLVPEDPALRRQALAWQSELDADAGPAVRTALFSVMLGEPGFLCRTFSRDRSALVRAAYRAGFPLAKRLMARANDADRPERVVRAFEIVGETLDRVARSVGPSGQLVGDAFGVADLTGAALLAPLVDTGHPDMARPEPVPEAVRALLARFADHDAAHWVREQYAKHRPPPAAL
jgi:glutathione S-transferase